LAYAHYFALRGQIFKSVPASAFLITGMSCWTQPILGRRRGAKWYYAAPPRRVMGPAGTVDGTIGRFLLPIGGGSVEVPQKFYVFIKDEHKD